MHYTAIPNLARAASLTVNTAALPSRRAANFTAAYEEWLDRTILKCYDIERDEENSLFDAHKQPLQLAWLLVCKANPWDRCVVICDGQNWSCADRQCCRYDSLAYIAAMKRCIALRRAARLAQARN